MTLAIIIPVLNDAQALSQLLGDLRPALSSPSSPNVVANTGVDVVVVDGGSSDGVEQVCANAGVRCIHSARGRGEQLAAGVEATTGALIWMLHADSRVEPEGLRALTALVHDKPEPRVNEPPLWGRCQLRFEPPLSGMRMVAFFMHWRSRLTGICTGDQGIFVSRRLLERVGGVPRQPLMEDIELSRRLKRLGGPPHVVPVVVRSSPRRWQIHGVWRTIFLMWSMRFRYWRGVSPEALASAYRTASPSTEGGAR